MKIAVIGGGAIGLLTTYYFSKLGFEVRLVTRTEEQKNELEKNGITLRLKDSVGNESVYAATFHEETYKKCELWIVTMKQYDLPQFFARWKGEEDLPEILFLQNGLGHLEKAEHLLPTTILAGSVTHGAMRKGYTEVIHTGKGNITVGEWLGETKALNKLPLLDPQFPIERSNNMIYILKRKLLINAVINPLTALFRVTNGRLLENKHFQAVTEDVFNEVIPILKLSGSEWEKVKQVIRHTAKNESSMYGDIKQGRKTEIDAITGYLLKLAEEEQVELPLTKFLHHSIRGLERSES